MEDMPLRDERTRLNIQAAFALGAVMLAIAAALCACVYERAYGVYYRREMSTVIIVGALVAFCMIVSASWLAISCLCRQRDLGGVPVIRAVSVYVLVCAFTAGQCAIRGCALRPRATYNEDTAGDQLKGFTAHQAVFRRLDPDGNGAHDYWTADVAGFSAITDKTGNSIRFIDTSVARADTKPAEGAYRWNAPSEPMARAGYYYQVMSLDEDGNPYRLDEDEDGKFLTNPTKYALCAFPDRYKRSGMATFIVNEEGIVYCKNIEGQPVEQWPGKDPKKHGWRIYRD